MSSVSIVVPVFRNVATIEPTYREVLAHLASHDASLTCEFLFVDDGSDDGSREEIQRLRGLDERVRLISFSRNFGQVPAIVAGVARARGDYVVVMSADLQDPPELMGQMLSAARAGFDVVLCRREEREDPLLARVASRIFYRLMRASNPGMPPGGFDYCLLNRSAAAQFNRIDERNRFFQGDVLWVGFQRAEIPYRRRRRTIGVSQWTIGAKLKYLFDGLLATSYWPLRLMGALGAMTALTGFGYAVVVTYARITEATPFRGFAPIVILILVLGGLNMLLIALIGEYVWRIYEESRKRPYYVIRDEQQSDL